MRKKADGADEGKRSRLLYFFQDKFPRIILLMVLDTASVFAAYVIGTWAPQAAVNGGYSFPFYRGGTPVFSLPQIAVFIAIYLIAFGVFGLYNSLWKNSGISEGISLIASAGTGTVVIMLVNIAFGNKDKFIIGISAMIVLMLVFLSRFGYRIGRRMKDKIRKLNRSGKDPIMIVGAGFFGAYVCAQIEGGQESKTAYVAMFVDDNPGKRGMRVAGVPVLGTTRDIPSLAHKYNIREIIIAIPSLTPERKSEIVALCHETKCHVKTVGSLQELSETPTMRDIRETSISDILFRKEVELDREGVNAYILHKVVMITGGGGSIGSEIARQIARFYPSKLILFDIYENTTYELYCELRRMYPWLDLHIRIGSVRERHRLNEVMEEFKPDLVVHCAAHKHVPLMETSPNEAIKNNVAGTFNVLKAADEHGVSRFVQLSTDKAVNPTSIMGATKRVTELIVQEYSIKSKMLCMTVRFGNVLGSHGSVIPLFEKQIKAGGPVLVTHPNITRYFMTIPEAAQLVLQAGAFGESGSIYVLDMGSPVKIMDLAERVIRFHGYTPNVDMPIEISGLRPGEKLYEELLMDDEMSDMKRTEHGRIFKAHAAAIDIDTFIPTVKALIHSAEDGDVERSIALLHMLVPSFKHESQNSEKSADDTRTA